MNIGNDLFSQTLLIIRICNFINYDMTRILDGDRCRIDVKLSIKIIGDGYKRSNPEVKIGQFSI